MFFLLSPISKQRNWLTKTFFFSRLCSLVKLLSVCSTHKTRGSWRQSAITSSGKDREQRWFLIRKASNTQTQLCAVCAYLLYVWREDRTTVLYFIRFFFPFMTECCLLFILWDKKIEKETPVVWHAVAYSSVMPVIRRTMDSSSPPSCDKLRPHSEKKKKKTRII